MVYIIGGNLFTDCYYHLVIGDHFSSIVKWLEYHQFHYNPSTIQGDYFSQGRTRPTELF